MKLHTHPPAPMKASAARQSAATGARVTPSSHDGSGPTIRPRLAQLASNDAAPASTGLPIRLKAGVEALSGLSLDTVRVHYNSAKPAGLNALAFAKGTDIHLGPGQEQHLPHEAWHVVQQAQGRVTPTVQMKDGGTVNHDAGLEREADVMGERAIAAGAHAGPTVAPVAGVRRVPMQSTADVAQLKTCPHCHWENAHAPGCTPESRAAAVQQRQATNRQAADQSMDNRTRAQQTHRQHGGDAKGRDEMYKRWNS